MRLLEDAVKGLPEGSVIPGETVFRLYDTFGFPEDLTADFARERSLAIDHSGFETHMNAQRERARKASRFDVVAGAGPKLEQVTEFLGYQSLQGNGHVVALFDAHGNAIQQLEAGSTGTVVLDRTPFYAESGGQIGDSGELTGRALRFVVEDTQKLGSAFGHIGRLDAGRLEIGAPLVAAVNGERRAAIVLNHSATHLLHAALRKVLGEHVQQKGSLVAPARLRFDFAHFEPVKPDDLRQIEQLVNNQIRLNCEALTRELAYEDAIEAGALAFFGDKYGDRVRVLSLGDFSTELCGGTHVRRAGDIGLFKITAETGIASGVRRIEAVTGRGALDYIDAGEETLASLAGLLKGGRADVETKVRQLLERARGLEREMDQLKQQLAAGSSRNLLDEVQEIDGVRLLVARIDGADTKALRASADQLKDKLGSGIVVLGGVEDDKVRLVAGVTSDLTDRYCAGELIKPVAACVGGSGGGRADFAQAGGSEPAKLDEALALVAGQLAGGSAETGAG
jgi:alanyl-tRNA synthetase